jgi:hypothetical protein
LADKSIPVVSQPHYSADLSPCDLFLFPWLKNHLRGRHFGTLDNILKSISDELKGIPGQHCYNLKTILPHFAFKSQLMIIDMVLKYIES